ncbi:hypothetical protein FUAX_01700 [Fulvitalea axinellae]|uniref:Lipocalin-like domain-containing protein n=1 Tax=Fulvitalea axinellae TaxID=1182444 RepID=A0AAU9CDA1_9BACT|nr:hypothetical protein FUAX_01700 [Fulvitalea axinellae]
MLFFLFACSENDPPEEIPGFDVPELYGHWGLKTVFSSDGGTTTTRQATYSKMVTFQSNKTFSYRTKIDGVYEQLGGTFKFDKELYIVILFDDKEKASHIPWAGSHKFKIDENSDLVFYGHCVEDCGEIFYKTWCGTMD